MKSKFHIPEHFFTQKEISLFEKKHGITFDDLAHDAKLKNLDLSIIDFSNKEEKEFLLEYGAPKNFIGKGFGFFA